MRDHSISLILDIEKKEKKLTNINGLKIKYNNFLGYYIDLSPVNHKLLKNENQRYIHRQTLKNSFRYTTTELIELSEKILSVTFYLLKKKMSFMTILLKRFNLRQIYYYLLVTQ